MELIGTMPQSIYKNSLFLVCCGFALKRIISAMLPPPQHKPALPEEWLFPEAPA